MRQKSMDRTNGKESLKTGLAYSNSMSYTSVFFIKDSRIAAALHPVNSIFSPLFTATHVNTHLKGSIG